MNRSIFDEFKLLKIVKSKRVTSYIVLQSVTALQLECSTVFVIALYLTKKICMKSTSNALRATEPVELIWVKDLPMSFPYRRDSYYVRECYPEYYEMIRKTFAESGIDIISLTGTPGIGKSIFYIYFLQRYRIENPKATIVTASFTIDRRLKSCRVFTADDYVGRKVSRIPDEKADIHLYDGPPDMEPYNQKMVTFTSPNYKWFKIIGKAENHSRMYMPIWTFEELKNANHYLNLEIIDNVLFDLFEVFGGVTRMCLALNVEYISQAKKELENNIRGLSSADDVINLLSEKNHDKELAQRLFHILPVTSKNPTFKRFYIYTIASLYVLGLMNKFILTKDVNLRKRLVSWLKESPEAISLVQPLFESLGAYKSPNSPISF